MQRPALLAKEAAEAAPGGHQVPKPERTVFKVVKCFVKKNMAIPVPGVVLHETREGSAPRQGPRLVHAPLDRLGEILAHGAAQGGV